MRWDYLTIDIVTGDAMVVQATLRDMGRDGWELVHVWQPPALHTGMGERFFFKRPLAEGSVE